MIGIPHRYMQDVITLLSVSTVELHHSLYERHRHRKTIRRIPKNRLRRVLCLSPINNLIPWLVGPSEPLHLICFLYRRALRFIEAYVGRILLPVIVCLLDPEIDNVSPFLGPMMLFVGRKGSSLIKRVDLCEWVLLYCYEYEGIPSSESEIVLWIRSYQPEG